jgi:hypothetical protein
VCRREADALVSAGRLESGKLVASSSYDTMFV